MLLLGGDGVVHGTHLLQVTSCYTTSAHWTGLKRSQQHLVPSLSRNPPFTVYQHLHHALFLLGIGSGQRQLIAVTCIAEHA